MENKKVTDSINLPINLDHNIVRNNPKNPDRIILLLHGYKLTGEFLYDSFIKIMPENSLVLAPNGPFIVPIVKKQAFSAGYAWYFFDPLKKHFYINYDPAAQFIKTLLENLNPNNLPVTIIGYSQGGYLAPKVAEVCPNIKSILGVNCVYRNNKFTFNPDVEYHQINGEIDLIVDPIGAKEEFDKLVELGNKGTFNTLPEEGHKISPRFMDPISKYLAT